MTVHPTEEAFVGAFIARDSRDRWISLLGSRKRRRKILERLAQCPDFDERLATLVPPAEQTPERISALLRQRGAPDSCHVISEWSELDGKEMLLSEVLSRIVGYGMGTIVSCVPARLAYYEGEDAGERYILERKAP